MITRDQSSGGRYLPLIKTAETSKIWSRDWHESRLRTSRRCASHAADSRSSGRPATIPAACHVSQSAVDGSVQPGLATDDDGDDNEDDPL